MTLFERVVALLLKNKAQALVDKLRHEPDMAEAIKNFEEAKIRLKNASDKFEKSQMALNRQKK